jgi:hypothetical protein
MGEAFDRITWHINNKAVGSRRDCLDTGVKRLLAGTMQQRP